MRSYGRRTISSAVLTTEAAVSGEESKELITESLAFGSIEGWKRNDRELGRL